VFGVGGGNVKKRWPLDNYFKLRDQLKCHSGIDFLFVVGPNELELYGEIMTADAQAKVACNLPLQTLKGILAYASGTITNDYAVMHMSAALNVPTLAVFLASDPLQWFSYAPPSRYIISNALACRPCYSEDCVNWECNDPKLFDLALVEAHKIVGASV